MCALVTGVQTCALPICPRPAKRVVRGPDLVRLASATAPFVVGFALLPPRGTHLGHCAAHEAAIDPVAGSVSGARTASRTSCGPFGTVGIAAWPPSGGPLRARLRCPGGRSCDASCSDN